MKLSRPIVTRRSLSGDIIGPNQRVDVITALKAMTICDELKIGRDCKACVNWSR